MEEKSANQKVLDALNQRDTSEMEEESKMPPEMSMDQSFYRKQGIDFLNFQRPGTAYGSAAFAQAAMNSTSSSFYSKGATQKPAMPSAAAASSSTSAESSRKTGQAVKNQSLSQLWITRAEKIGT